MMSKRIRSHLSLKWKSVGFSPQYLLFTFHFINPIFLNRQSLGGGGGVHEDPHHNFVVVAPMIMKFGTGIKLDVFYTMVTKSL